MKGFTEFLLPLALLTAGTANAATLQIQFTGLDLFYDDSEQLVCDATNCEGGVGSLTDADPLVEVEFLVDSVWVGSVNTIVGADILLGLDDSLDWDTASIDSAGIMGGWFDILMNDTTGWGLGLEVLSGGFAIVDNIASFTGEGIIGNVCTYCPGNPSLPFGLVAGDVFSVSWSSEIFNVDYDDPRDFGASGIGTVSSVAVPEPTSLALLGFGLIGAAIARRRSTKAS